MKTCENCNTVNPNDAKFCRSCGEGLLSVPPVEWRETSEIKLSRGKDIIWSILLLPLMFVLFVVVAGGLTGFGYWDYPSWIHEGIFYVYLAVWIITFFIVFINVVTRGKRKKNQLCSIASAIENSQRNDRYLTKAGKYGLYDWKKRKVLLPVEYDALESMDYGSYYILSKETGKGIYSRLLNRVIVPCEYDAVTPFAGHRATVTKNNVTKQVDTQGNLF